MMASRGALIQALLVKRSLNTAHEAKPSIGTTGWYDIELHLGESSKAFVTAKTTKKQLQYRAPLTWIIAIDYDDWGCVIDMSGPHDSSFVRELA